MADKKNWWDYFSLSGQKNSKSDPAIAGGTGERKMDMGVAGDIFNWLGRPSKAISTGVYNIGDDDQTTSFTQGLKDGLTGKSQINWSDILEQKGIKNPLVKSIGGFAGDVLFDPLTYTGVEFAKGANMTNATARIAREVGEAGVARSPKAFTDAVASRVADIAQDDPAHLYATFMGKKIGPKFRLPVDAAKTARNFIAGEEGDSRRFAKALSMERELPFGLADVKRRLDTASAADHAQAIGAIDKHFGFLTNDQGRTVSIGLENGEDLSHIPTDFNGREPIRGLETLEGVKQVMQSTMHRFGHDEVQLGMLQPEQLKENYVNRLYRNGKRPEAYPGLSQAAAIRTAGRDLDAARKALDQEPLQNLLEMPGVDIETHPAELLKSRAKSHFRKVGRAKFPIEAINNAGIEGTDANLAWLRENGYIPTKHLVSPAARQFDGAHMYLPKDMVKALNGTEEILTDNNVGGSALRGLDYVNRKFKTLNTVVSPGFWARNTMSDTLMAIANGVYDPKHFQQAFRIIKENAANKTDDYMNEVLRHGVEQGVMDPALARAATATTGVRSKINLGGKIVDSDVAWQRFLKEGGHSGDITSSGVGRIDPEAVQGLGESVRNSLGKAAQVPGDVTAKLANWASNKEDFYRLAQFLKEADKHVKSGVPWQDAMVKAGDNVRNTLVDYGKLSSWERNTARRAIPFYSWMRRNLPLQAKMLFTRPGFMAGYSKGQDLLQGLLGADDGAGDQLIPEWIRNSMPVRLAMGKQEAKNPITKLIRMAAGAGPKDAAFAPLLSSMTPLGDVQNITDPVQKFVNAGGFKNPVSATQKAGSEVFKELLNQSTPVLKAPVELATQRSLFTDSPIKDWGPWVFGQIAPTRLAYNVAQRDQAKSAAGITSWLSGLQLQAVTPERQKAEANRQEQVIRGRGDIAKQSQWQAYLKQLRQMTGQEAKPQFRLATQAPTYRRVFS